MYCPYKDKNNKLFQVENLAAIQCDLAGCLESRLAHSVDILIFNPPYVPTENADLSTDDWLTRSWAGGQEGRLGKYDLLTE